MPMQSILNPNHSSKDFTNDMLIFPWEDMKVSWQEINASRMFMRDSVPKNIWIL
jgi:hypothetical protein